MLGGLDSGLYACVTIALLTEPSPQTLLVFFQKHLSQHIFTVQCEVSHQNVGSVSVLCKSKESEAKFNADSRGGSSLGIIVWKQ